MKTPMDFFDNIGPKQQTLNQSVMTQLDLT